jgi:hypothetical protein
MSCRARTSYPPDLHDGAIGAGAAYITPTRVEPLGETEDDQSV